MSKLLVGAHTSTKNGIIEGISYIQKIGGNSAQIFLGSNKSSSLKMKTKLTDEECARIKRYCELNNFHLYIHAVYVLNFSSFPSSSARIKYALDNVIYDVEWGYKMGVKGVVIHLGYQKDLEEMTAYENMASNIVYIVKHTTKSPVKLLLETPAGAGSQIGTDIPQFIKVFVLIKEQLDPKTFNSRVGVCLDTAHIFSSGHNISTPSQAEIYLNTYYSQMENYLNTPISLIHLNDSRVGLNSRRDIHAGLGQGEIYNRPDSSKALQFFLKYIYKKSHNIPFILETHGAGAFDSEKDATQYKQEISLVKELVSSTKSKPINIKPITIKNKKIKAIKKSRTNSRVNNYVLYENNKMIVKTLMIVKNYYESTNNKIKSNAYKKAIYQIKIYPYEIKSGIEIEHLDGIGSKMIEKIDEVLETGTLRSIKEKGMNDIIEKSKKKPDHVFGSILGFGPTIVNKLINKKILSLAQLKKEIYKENSEIKLTKLQTLGLKYHEDLSQFVAREEAEHVFKMMDNIYGKLKTTNEKRLIVLPAGSFPSGKSESKDIDILIVKEDNNKITMVDMKKHFELMSEQIKDKFGFEVLEILSSGESNMMLIVSYDYSGSRKVRHLDMKLTTKSELPYSYLHFTSGADYNRYIRDKAKVVGYKLNDKGLFKGNRKVDIELDNDYMISKISKKQLIKKTEGNIKLILNYIGLH